MRYVRARAIIRLLGVAFALNWVWEAVHASAFVETQGPLVWRAWHCLPMAVVDAAWVLGLYLTVRAACWLAGYTPPVWTLMALLAVTGAASAIALELRATSTGRWTYTDTMPIVPGVRIGLWPVVQMVVLPGLAVWAAGLLRTSTRRGLGGHAS